MKVLERIVLPKNRMAIVCELFPDSDITSRIKTNIGEFSDFFVEKPKNCFSVAKTRNIIFQNISSEKQITSLSFV